MAGESEVRIRGIEMMPGRCERCGKMVKRPVCLSTGERVGINCALRTMGIDVGRGQDLTKALAYLEAAKTDRNGLSLGILGVRAARLAGPQYGYQYTRHTLSLLADGGVGIGAVVVATIDLREESQKA